MPSPFTVETFPTGFSHVDSRALHFTKHRFERNKLMAKKFLKKEEEEDAASELNREQKIDMDMA